MSVYAAVARATTFVSVRRLTTVTDLRSIMTTTCVATAKRRREPQAHNKPRTPSHQVPRRSRPRQAATRKLAGLPINPVQLRVARVRSASGRDYVSATPVPTRRALGSFGRGDLQLQNPRALDEYREHTERFRHETAQQHAAWLRERRNSARQTPKTDRDRLRTLPRRDATGRPIPTRVLRATAVRQGFYAENQRLRTAAHKEKRGRVELIAEPLATCSPLEVHAVRRQLPNLLATSNATHLDDVNNPNSSTPNSNVDTSISPFFRIPYLHPYLAQFLSTCKFKGPTDIQTVVLPSILEDISTVDLANTEKKHNVYLFAAETGSGKTLAYLLPLIQLIKYRVEAHEMTVSNPTATLATNKQATSNKSQALDDDLLEEMFTKLGEASWSAKVTNEETDQQPADKSKRAMDLRKTRGEPRGIVLVPTHDLVGQVTFICKTLCKEVKLSVFGSHGSRGTSVVRKHMSSSPADILITTPDHLKYLLQSKIISLRKVEMVCIDEADTLLDRKFAPTVQSFFESMTKAKTSGKQGTLSEPYVLFTSATIPVTMLSKVKELLPEREIITRTTPMLHRQSPRVQARFVQVGGNTTKLNELLEVLKQAVLTEENIMIFCNSNDSVANVMTFLKEKKYDPQQLTAAVDYKARNTLTKLLNKPNRLSNSAFRNDKISSENDTEQKEEDDPSSEQNPVSPTSVKRIVVATDIASRGIDTSAVNHVILFDFPHTMIDYLHRVGRAGRMGRRGQVTCLIARKDRSRAEELRKALLSQQSLSQLSR